jgi:hypothetical protein
MEAEITTVDHMPPPLQSAPLVIQAVEIYLIPLDNLAYPEASHLFPAFLLLITPACNRLKPVPLMDIGPGSRASAKDSAARNQVALYSVILVMLSLV